MGPRIGHLTRSIRPCFLKGAAVPEIALELASDGGATMSLEKLWRLIVDVCRVYDTVSRIRDQYWP